MHETVQYFKPEEFRCEDGTYGCMDSTLLDWLPRLRSFAGVPFNITSAFRSPEHNAAVGGVKNSPHLGGHAVDISCPNSRIRYKMLESFFLAGLPESILKQIKEFREETGRYAISRIGIGKTFLHIDTQESKDQEVIWVY